MLIGRTLPLAMIYGTFLSLPSAQEKGLLIISFTYLATTILVAALMLVMRVKGSTRTYQGTELAFMALIIVLLCSNFFVAVFNDISMTVWMSRIIHVPMILVYIIILKYSDLSIDDVLHAIFVVGVIEGGLIYLTFFAQLGIDAQRGTDIQGVIVYSVVLVFAAYLALLKYNQSKRFIYLMAYFALLFASILTGTRGLILAIAVLMMVLRLNWLKMVAFLAAIGGLYYLLVNGFLDRFNIQDQDNIVTILSKLEEVIILYNFWESSPIFGVGFGYEFQTSIAASPYNYSHNALLFYLGYGGLLALSIYLGPLIRIWRAQQKAIWLVLGISLFYTTSTTFTNVKHSLVMAILIFVGTMVARERRLSYRAHSEISGLSSRTELTQQLLK